MHWQKKNNVNKIKIWKAYQYDIIEIRKKGLYE